MFGILILLSFGSIYYKLKSKILVSQKPIACTQEAKLCPDGSYVGRTGSRCEFSECPLYISPTKTTSGITGTVLLGPTCPVMRDPPDPQCADRQYQTDKLVLLTSPGLKLVQKINSGKDGKFTVEIPPGEYSIQSSGKITFPYCGSGGVIEVIAGKFSEITVYCDTGIR
ncbi:MAG: hypothetical protein WAX85_02075 [Minisyncoccia bacterium]